jgi:hypothetical protein
MEALAAKNIAWCEGHLLAKSPQRIRIDEGLRVRWLWAIHPELQVLVPWLQIGGGYDPARVRASHFATTPMYAPPAIAPSRMQPGRRTPGQFDPRHLDRVSLQSELVAEMNRKSVSPINKGKQMQK